MRTLSLLALLLVPMAARAVGPTVTFTLPALNTPPTVFGSLPFPNDLYFDQGSIEGGDGTLLDHAHPTIGLGTDVLRANAASVEDALDTLDGFGTTTAIFFFFSGPLDAASLPASPVLAPAVSDSVFCVNASTGTAVPIALKFGVDTRIPNVLSILPLPGRPLDPQTTYACVVRTAVTGGGQAVQPSADWVSVRDGTSANDDADTLYDPAIAVLGAHGVPANQIAGMTVFTTQSTASDLLSIQSTVLPGIAMPSADFTSRPELVFDDPTKLASLLGTAPHGHIGKIATGFYGSPRFTTHDPNGDGPLGDFPTPPDFINCATPCETTDESFVRDPQGRPLIQDTPQIPFTVVVPTGTPPATGWPVIIQQHGLGGQRDTVVLFGEADAAAGFASIGIDASGHGYRYFDCTPAAVCSADTANNFGGTAIPDGFADGSNVGFLTVNLGFFEGFHNFLAVRDHFRQTYADLLSLVRLIKSGSIDTGLVTHLDGGNIFYMGHSLGGLMGSGFVPIEPDLKASLLNATGGGLTNLLFLNSSIGGGALSLVTGILGLDPANVFDAFAIQPNLTQTIIDPADGLNSASLLLAPAAGTPRNVIQVEDFGDQVVPNQANEALAAASGLQIFDPFVQNLHQNPLALPVVSTPGSVRGNAAGGATAALLQNGPATHAQSIVPDPATVTFVPEFAHDDDYVLTGNGFPMLVRGIRVPNAGIFDSVLAWFRDIVAHGPPGTFSFDGEANFNPIQNLDAPSGASTERFFARTVGAGGARAHSESTPDVVVAFSANTVASRVTAGRSILGTSSFAADEDVPPGPAITVGTPGVLPFFVTLQRQIPGVFGADLTIAYTTAELSAAGLTPGSAGEASLVIGRFVAGTCTTGAASCAEDGECGANGPCAGAHYAPYVSSSVDLQAHTVTAPGVADLGIFAVLGAQEFAVTVGGGGSARSDCRASYRVVDPSGGMQVTRRGRTEIVPTCHDGDPTCDADGAADGTCTFRLAVCFNIDLPGSSHCTRPPLTGYTLVQPKVRGRRAADRQNADALLQTLVAFGGQRGNARQSAVRFRPAFTDGKCTPLASFRVATQPGTATIRGLARGAHGVVDADKLRLSCKAAS